MESNSPRDSSEDPRTGFVRSLPRKVVEIKATFGALIADPRSTRMRDELRRKLHALYTLARSYQLTRLSDALVACVDILDATRAMPTLARPHIDSLAGYIASFSHCIEGDTQEPAATPSAGPTGTREDASRAATVRIPAAGSQRVAAKITLPPDLSGTAETPTADGRPTPYRTLPPGTTLRKGVGAGHGAAVHILFVGSSARANALHEALPPDVELLVTRTAGDAAQRAKDAAPDVIVAEMAGLADGAGLLATLRADPLTEFFPVVLVAPAGEALDEVRERIPEAAEVLADNTDGAALWDSLERIVGGAANPVAGAHEFGDVTLDELARVLQDEIRRGIVAAASPRARGARIPLGGGNEVLAAAWEAIARIREVVERRSQGAVRFELPAAPRGLPGTSVVTPGEEGAQRAEVEGDDPLPGRKVLVVDDDPAVVANFATLFREAGANVTECTSGELALGIARRIQPDLVISDIVMPGLDGFGLCQAIRRDPTLRHTPVVLLSWRDDLLVRMREMGAQAQGYLRKEAGGAVILARARDAIRLRVRLLERVAALTGAAEVRGRLERVGLAALLEVAAASLGDATVTVSDPWSVTELHVRGRALASALRTAHDGSLLRGEAALVPVLGASSARFAVTRSKAHVRENLEGPVSEVLSRCARRLGALEGALSGPSLLEVVRVEIDREAALAYARTLPARMSAVVERVAAGESPRDLILRDAMAPSDLEPVLVELARRGAIQRVFDTRGEDLTAVRMSSIESAAPPALSEVRPDLLAKKAAAEAKPDSKRATVSVDDDAAASLADAVWRELRDSVHDDPNSRWNAPTPALPSPPPEAHPADDAAADDLPPLPEIIDAFEATRTPAMPMPARLIAASIPSSEARHSDRAVSDRAETRRVPSVPSPPREREELATTAPSNLDARQALASLDEEVAHTSELPDGVLDALKQSLVADASTNEAAPARGSNPAGDSKPSAEPKPRSDSKPSTEPRSLSDSKPAAPRISTESRVSRESRPGGTKVAAAAKASDEAAERASLETSDVRAAKERRASVEPGERTSSPGTRTRPPTPPLQATQTRSGARPKPPKADVTGPQKAATESDHSDAFEAIRNASADPIRIAAPGTAPPARPQSRPPQRDGDGWSMRPALLLLGVGAAFAGSYYGVRWYLSRTIPPETLLQPEASADAEPTPVEPTPIEGAPAEAPSPEASDAGATASDDASALPANVGATVAPRVDAPAAGYHPVAAWLDGGALAPREGLLVVLPPTPARAVTVQVDARPTQALPLTSSLPEGMHAVRFIIEGRTRYRLATVRAGQALVLQVPSGQ